MNGTASKNTAPYVVAGIVSIFLITIAYAMFFVPKMNESRTLAAQAASAHASNAALSAKADELAETAANLGPLKARVAAFAEAFPLDAGQENLIASINEAASSTGVTLTTLSPRAPIVPDAEAAGAEAAEAPVQKAPEGTNLPGAVAIPAPEAGQGPADESAPLGSVALKIDGIGSLEALRAFVVKIEALKRPLVVEEIKLDKQDDQYHVTISGTTYMASPLTVPDTGR